MRYYLLVTDILGVLNVIAVLASVFLLLGLVVPRIGQRIAAFREQRPWFLPRVALAVAVVAMSGSLYFSNIGFVPCHLCWYQRILIYPLVLILGIAVLTKHEGYRRYALALPATGLPISIYHYALQWQPALEVIECDPTHPCTTKYFEIYGFITIPFMAGMTSLLILSLLIWADGRTDGLTD